MSHPTKSDSVPAHRHRSRARAKTTVRERLSSPVLLYVLFSLLLVVEVGAARSLLFSDASLWRTIGLEAAFVLALLSIVEALGSRWRFATYAASACVVSVALLGIVIYASWADQLLAPNSIQFVREAWDARSSVGALFRPSYTVFVLGALVPAALLYFSRKTPPSSDARRHPVLLGLGAVALVACVFLTEVAGHAAAAGDSLTVGRLHGLLAYEVSMLKTSTREGHDEDSSAIDPSVNVSDSMSVDSRVAEILDRSAAARVAGFKPGAYAGANVIVIQVESMQQFVVNLKAGSEVVTPNLNALAKQSWYFPNAFSQIGPGNTADAEFVMNTSLFAPREDAAAVKYASKDVPSLAKLLADQSYYYSFTMHANTARFWNRTQLYPTLGFADYYDREFFGTEDPVGMGMSDGLMFKKALPVVLDQAHKGPFYCQIVTLSPHHPFRLPSKKQRLDLPGWLGGTVVGDYLQSMNYEDRCVGWFINRLKKDGLWDKSIVVIYGDHFGLRPADLSENENRARYEELLGHPYTGADRANIPLLIHLPGQTVGRVGEHPVGQADIMPTIADALGLDLSGTVHMGQSAFEPGRNLVPLNAPLPLGSFVEGNTFYIGNSSTEDALVVSLSSRRTSVTPPGYRMRLRNAEELYQLSTAYVRSLPTSGDTKLPKNSIIPGHREK